FACVLHRDGSVACAGVNNHMQLGDGTTTDRSSFAAVKGVTGVTQIVNGYYHACALLADHTVTCWGDIEMTGQGEPSSSRRVRSTCARANATTRSRAGDSIVTSCRAIDRTGMRPSRSTCRGCAA